MFSKMARENFTFGLNKTLSKENKPSQIGTMKLKNASLVFVIAMTHFN